MSVWIGKPLASIQRIMLNLNTHDHLIELGARTWWSAKTQAPSTEPMPDTERYLPARRYNDELKAAVDPASVLFAIELA